MIPFLIGGVLLIAYRNRIADALRAGDHGFYSNLLGEERTLALEEKAGSRWERYEPWVPRILLVFGIFWVLISLIVMLGLLI